MERAKTSGVGSMWGKEEARSLTRSMSRKRAVGMRQVTKADRASRGSLGINHDASKTKGGRGPRSRAESHVGDTRAGKDIVGGVGNGEWGVGSGEWGVGNGEWGIERR